MVYGMRPSLVCVVVLLLPPRASADEGLRGLRVEEAERIERLASMQSWEGRRLAEPDRVSPAWAELEALQRGGLRVLRVMARHPSPVVRAYAGYGLIRHPRGAALVRSLLDDEEPVEKRVADLGVPSMVGLVVLDAVLEAAQQAEPLLLWAAQRARLADVRREATRTLAARCDPHAAAVARSATNASDVERRVEGFEALRDLGVPLDVGRALATLPELRLTSRLRLLYAIAADPDPRVQQALVQQAADPDGGEIIACLARGWPVRHSAVELSRALSGCTYGSWLAFADLDPDALEDARGSRFDSAIVLGLSRRDRPAVRAFFQNRLHGPKARNASERALAERVLAQWSTPACAAR